MTCAVAAWLVAATPASNVRAADGDHPGLFTRLTAKLRAPLTIAPDARHPVAPVAPPQPIDVHWKVQRIGSLDLGGSLLALTAADLDGDGRAELYAVTAREVIAIAIDHRVRELGRVAFGGPPAAAPPRDVVGAVIADHDAVIASASPWERGLRVRWRNHALVAEPGEPGFVLCAGHTVQLAPGRNFFGTTATPTYGERCRDDLVDPTGAPLHVHAVLSIGGKLEVVSESCPATGCLPAVRGELDRVGVAFELADVDRDGRIDVVYASAAAPGDPDAVTVVTLGDDPKHPRIHKTFIAGGVAGVAVADIDGDGKPDAIAAVRLVGSTRVDLWRLD